MLFCEPLASKITLSWTSLIKVIQQYARKRPRLSPFEIYWIPTEFPSLVKIGLHLQKLEYKRKDGQMDGRTDNAIKCIVDRCCNLSMDDIMNDHFLCYVCVERCTIDYWLVMASLNI